MAKITSEYISWDCIKSTMQSAHYLIFENSDYKIMYYITFIRKNNKNISVPIYCREYNKELALKQQAFDEALERIKRYNPPSDLDILIHEVYRKCFL